MKKTFDIRSATLSVTDKSGKSHLFSLQGLTGEVVKELALIGAAAVLERRRDIPAAIKQIRAGILGRKPKEKYAAVVKAIASVYEIPLPQAQNVWNNADAKRRADLRKNPAIVRELLIQKYEGIEVEGEPSPDEISDLMK